MITDDDDATTCDDGVITQGDDATTCDDGVIIVDGGACTWGRTVGDTEFLKPLPGLVLRRPSPVWTGCPNLLSGQEEKNAVRQASVQSPTTNAFVGSA